MMRRLQECHRLGGGAHHVGSFTFTIPQPLGHRPR
jgi:hypothetical protein